MTAAMSVSGVASPLSRAKLPVALLPAAIVHAPVQGYVCNSGVRVMTAGYAAAAWAGVVTCLHPRSSISATTTSSAWLACVLAEWPRLPPLRLRLGLERVSNLAVRRVVV